MATDSITKDMFERIGPCLDELEQEYLKVGIDHCNKLEDHSQLSAFLMVGIRSICLLRGMLHLSDPQFLDSYDSVRRSFIESWQLQFDFKLRDSTAKAQKWLERQPEWQADRTNNLSAFRIDPIVGTLTYLPSSPIPVGSDPVSVTIDVSGTYLYVVNQGDNTVSAFSIDPASGALTQLPGSPFVGGAIPTSITTTGKTQ